MRNTLEIWRLKDVKPRLSERLRYSVGGTYRFYGPRQMPESMISEAHASFVSCSQVFFCLWLVLPE